MHQATLCLLIRDSQEKKELLLAMKKRGFGVGKWNGVGGKLDSEKGDRDIEEAAVREAREEIGVQIKEMEKVALLRFKFPYKQDWNQDVHVFLVKDWAGEPQETEEMMPKWFAANEIPFQEMWDDDKIWLPHVLAGKKLTANFIFKEGEIINDQDVKFVEEV